MWYFELAHCEKQLWEKLCTLFSMFFNRFLYGFLLVFQCFAGKKWRHSSIVKWFFDLYAIYTESVLIVY